MHMELTISEKIKLVIKRKGLKMGDIAAKLGCSRQNLHRRFDRNSWTDATLKEISDAIGMDYEIVFTDKESGEKY